MILKRAKRAGGSTAPDRATAPQRALLPAPKPLLALSEFFGGVEGFLNYIVDMVSPDALYCTVGSILC
jgi:hypothetical protein